VRPVGRPGAGCHHEDPHDPGEDIHVMSGTNQRAQIVMSEAEVAEFLERERTATMATVGPDGTPHLVAMWYGLIDGTVWFETKAKSQKVQNLRRNDRITCLVERGYTYDTLQGVSLEGRGVIVDDPDVLWQLGVNVFERYNGPYSDELKPFVEVMLRNRVAVRIDVDRVRSWDHRKLGMDGVPLGGTTAEFIERV
jgi:PPOX class probable F420-dependent enzyme